MSYFKDITESLSKKYPDTNVYVISDQHFDHKNIISLTRNNLFNTEDIDKMNEYIINEHNKVVSNDDIVLILGDFSFKRSNEQIRNFTSKLNGHKFLILGNHDNTDRIDIYLRSGFEDVYLYPVQFNEDYYSHYPLNASIESEERPNTILYNLLCKEFQKTNSGTNYHGHQHIKVNNGNRERNVTCEELSYKPLLIGKTKSNTKEDKLPFINEEFFNIMHKLISKNNHLQEKGIVTDYLYTILLEILSEYKEDIAVYGSCMLNKKYGPSNNPSDLDVTKLYDPSKSKRENMKDMNLIIDNVYEEFNKVSGIHLDFFKKIDFICILSYIYANKKYNLKGYLDMNIITDEFYKSDDFILKDGKSFFEYYTKKAQIDDPKTIRYPRFNIKTTNAFADLTNCYLQYLYTTDNKSKKTLLQKMKTTLKNTEFSSKNDFETLQNMMIRYLLRNIYFFENTNRKNESDIILLNKDLKLPNIAKRDNPVEDSLRIIIYSDEYNQILNSISKSDNRKETVKTILKEYKRR